jgi:hypothetical protein
LCGFLGRDKQFYELENSIKTRIVATKMVSIVNRFCASYLRHS